MSVTSLAALIKRHLDRTPNSGALALRGRATSPVPNSRSVTQHAPYALTMIDGSGAYLWDADGNRYLDLVSNLFSLVHGNAYGPAVEAATEQMRRGSAYPANNQPHLELAERLVARLPAVDQVMFCNSGTEAFNSALSVARFLTGRYKFLMARRGYHGSSYDTLLGTSGVEGPITFVADYGDAASFEAVLDAHGHEIAAVFLEPVMGAGGLVAPPDGFLEQVYAAAKRHGALFVLDEIVTFRLSTGGAQATLPFKPDLSLLGKIIGGGFPVGAVGGSRDIMEAYVAPATRVGASGTFNGNPVTMAAGAVVVRDLTADQIARINAMGERVAAALPSLAERHGFTVSPKRAGSIVRLDFGADHDRIMPHLLLAALSRGLFLHSRGVMVFNTAMTEQDVDEVLGGLAACFEELAACGLSGFDRQPRR